MKKIILMLIMLMGLVSITNAVTSSTPASGGTVNDTYNFTAVPGIDDVTNCTWATTSDGIFAFSLNHSVSTSSMWNRTATTSLTEIADTTLTITCYNTSYDGTTGTESTTITINVDNTNPTCSCSSDTIVSLHDQLNYDCSGSSDTTDLTYSCVMTYDDATTETETNDRGYFEDTFALGEATLACTVTDEATKTNTCASITVTIENEDQIPEDEETTPDGNKNMIVIILIAIAAVVSIVIMITTSGKKKRKR